MANRLSLNGKILRGNENVVSVGFESIAIRNHIFMKEESDLHPPEYTNGSAGTVPRHHRKKVFVTPEDPIKPVSGLKLRFDHVWVVLGLC